MTTERQSRIYLLNAEACEAWSVASEKMAEASRLEGEDDQARLYDGHAASYARSAEVYRNLLRGEAEASHALVGEVSNG